MTKPSLKHDEGGELNKLSEPLGLHTFPALVSRKIIRFEKVIPDAEYEPGGFGGGHPQWLTKRSTIPKTSPFSFFDQFNSRSVRDQFQNTIQIG